MKKLKEIITNLVIYVISFFIVYFIKRDTFVLSEIYLNYFYSFISCWFLASLLSGKFISSRNIGFWSAARSYLISFFFFLGLSAFSNWYFEMYELSRTLILCTLFVPFILELIYLRITTPILNKNSNNFYVNISLLVFMREINILSLSILILFAANKEIFPLAEINLLLLFGIYMCWIISSVFAGNMSGLHHKTNKIRHFWSYVKSYIIFFILSSFLLMFVRVNLISPFSFLTAVALYILFSSLIQFFLILKRTSVKSDEINLKILKATTYSEYFGDDNGLKKNGKYVFNSERGLSPLLTQKLFSTYLAKHKKVFDFINKKINLETFNELKSVILKSSDPYNIEVLPDNYLEFYLNLHETNDIRRINNYFIEINKRLVNGGIYISKFEPTRLRHKRFMNSYPYYLAQAIYFLDFMYKRVMPKLPIIKKIYFILTNGRNRAISLAEGLGRLYYCGFEIIDIMEIENYVYFIAKKVSVPSNDKNPSYGPFFKMKRVGFGGKTIYVYKLRTMHPYSEYIQKLTFDLMGTKDGDKIINDFRITVWGKILRKFWIDELPMLINLFKGQLKLVGVRPLSLHKFSTYPDDLQIERIKFKPGLIPPYYADMPKTIEEFFETERKYLENYKKHSTITDIKYFFKAFYNIIIKKARSG